MLLIEEYKDIKDITYDKNKSYSNSLNRFRLIVNLDFNHMFVSNQRRRTEMEEYMKEIKNNLIVSCQALENEPLHSPFIMSRMALAAKMGGAKGIRANSIDDIREIKKIVDLPIIGIIKKDYPGTSVYITPTMKEIDDLVKERVDIIAMDATFSKRLNGETLDEFFKKVKNKYPQQIFMADCSTVAEAIHADKIGFDFIGTTLVGYTPQSKGDKIEANDFEIMRKIIKEVKHPVIGEGNLNTPIKAKRALDLGCYSVVVGSMITRPQVITKYFVDEIKK